MKAPHIAVISFAAVVGVVSALATSALAAGDKKPPYADPVKSDGDKYKTILENDRVRVLAYDDKPGARTSMHHHPDFVLYALAPFKRKLTFGDGTTAIKELKAGDVIWMKAQDHIGENIGTTDTHVIIVELKEPPPASTHPRATP